MPLPSVWPLHRVAIFDCDSTLSAIEGIDELARMSGYEHDVAALTKRAMEGDIPLEAVYGQRLGTARPTREQVRAIAGLYREAVVTGAREVISALLELGIDVFIVSGGLYEPVREFGAWLGLPREHVHAVGMAYDQLAGHWWRYWDHSPEPQYLAHEANPLSAVGGKGRVIREIRSAHPGRALLVGDGGSDLVAAGEVDLFVGFGGVAYRKRVAEESPVYIHAPDLSPLLPLAAGTAGNTPETARLWAAGLSRIVNAGVTFNDGRLEEAFWGAVGRR
jgi:phosphoserine phosphatase